MQLVSAPGWFGKIAMLGDFASRRLPRDWVDACDHWLSTGLRTSQARLGAQWLQTYLSAPVWRFAWAPGVIDGQWWFGVLMPSCDSVGRYFPLVVAQARAYAPADRVGLDHLERWWSHLAQAALHTLVDHASLDGFEAALHDASPWPGVSPLPASAAPGPVVAQQGERHAVPSGATLVDFAANLAANGLRARLAGMSCWWPLREPGSFTLHHGLPPPDAYAQMLTGEW